MNGKRSVCMIAMLLIGALLSACGKNVTIEPLGERNIAGHEVRVEEIGFRSGKFKIVGELLIPAVGERHPAVIMVHGDGPATRKGSVPFRPLIEIFLRSGYAVYSWDKPGSGESTGKLDGEHTAEQRAEILADGVEVLAEHPAIDPAHIGLWGISQAGWVMPLALELTDNIAFMVVVSGGAEEGIEQMAYQVGQRVICGGGTEEQAALVEQYWSQHAKTTSYAEYREAMEVLVEIPQVRALYRLEIKDEKAWRPWPRDIGAFFDPVTILEQTTIPVLAIYGELDKNIDPVQGASAYEAALEKAGNQHYQVVVISGAGHILAPAKTGCIGEYGGSYAPEYLETLETWMQQLP